MNKAEISRGELIKTRKDSSEVFELANKAFNKMPFFVKLFVLITLFFAIS